MSDQTKLTTLILIYGSALGVCYLTGFWSVFNINVFQYADLMDVLKASIIPVSIAGLGVILGSLLGMASHGDLQPTQAAIGSKRAKIITFFIFWKGFITTLWVFAAILVNAFVRAPLKWEILSAMVFPISTYLNNTKLLRDLIPELRVRNMVASVAMALPFVAVYTGGTEATAITAGQAKYVVDAINLAIPLGSESSDHFSYVGFVGSTFFLYDESNKSLLLMKQNDRSIVLLKPNPKLK